MLLRGTAAWGPSAADLHGTTLFTPLNAQQAVFVELP